MCGVGDGSGRVVSVVVRQGLGEQELEENRGSEVREGADGGQGRRR